MSITIAHLVGPLAGQEQHFDDSVEVIIFGRSPECQVVYPPDCAEVGRKHFALRRNAAGDYLVVLFSDRFVAIDGIPVANGAVVKSRSGVRLGRAGGPSFRLKLGSETAEIAWRADEAEDDAYDALSMAKETIDVENMDDVSDIAKIDEVLSKTARHAKIASEFEADGVVDLLFKRRSEPPAVVAGISADVALQQHWEPEFPVTEMRPPVRVGAAERPRGSFDPWFDDLLRGSETQSPPKGVGSGGPLQSQPPESGPPGGTSLGNLPQRPSPDMTVESAPQMPARARRGGVLWWIVAAAALAALGYFLYRREFVVSAALGKLFQAAVPPPTSKAANADLVDVSVFGPTAIQAGGEGLIQVFLHTLGQREIAKALAQEADSEATRRGAQTLAAEIAQGQGVQIVLEGRGVGVDQQMQTVVWRGEPCACQFTVSAAANPTGRTFHPRVLVLVDSVPVGSLTFALKVTAEAASKTEPELRGDRARRYSYAFLSYASPDRAEVLKRAQGLKAGGTSFFNDLLSLEPGERWERRLYQEIDRCDVFYLFWSSKAKDSEWVMKETEYALARRAASANGDPDIIPIIIEGPPSATPPESLKDIHFNDSLLYVLAGIAGGSSVVRN